MTESHNIVRVAGVTKEFQLGKVTVQALKGIDLEIQAGQYISIMGPSGSGKSTLFNMIGGLDKPTSGKVFIDEVDIAQLDAYELAWLRCRKIGYIFQTFNLIPVMTALENVTLPMTFAGTSNDDAIEKGMMFLKLVGLQDRRTLRGSASQDRRGVCLAPREEDAKAQCSLVVVLLDARVERDQVQRASVLVLSSSR